MITVRENRCVQNPDPTQPTEISHNTFINNSTVNSADSGTGVFVSNGPADSTTIEDNSFTGDDQTAINTHRGRLRQRPVPDKVGSSTGHDCEDDRTGSLIAGTANTWRHDTGSSKNSTPAGICS